MTKKLPPLNPLKVFEAVARFGSITNASKELFITQAAVSRQIYVLEDFLQEQLFIHRRGKITLTDTGRAYFEAISPSLRNIAQATNVLMSNRNQNVVSVITYQTFAHHWLIPRLSEFRREHPQIEVHVLTQVKPVDPSQASNDIIIHFGEGNWPGYNATKIIDDRITPICSPEFRERYKLKGDIAELEALPILHANYRRRDWFDWLRSVDHAEFDFHNAMYFRSSGLAYQAAQHGLGVAIGQLELLDEAIRAGRIVTMYDTVLTRPLGYYLLHAENTTLPPAARRFCNWILDVTASARDPVAMPVAVARGAR